MRKVNYIYYKSSDFPTAEYIFKLTDNYEYYYMGKIIYTFNKERDIGMTTYPPKKDCKVLEDWEVVKYKLLGFF